MNAEADPKEDKERRVVKANAMIPFKNFSFSRELLALSMAIAEIEPDREADSDLS